LFTGDALVFVASVLGKRVSVKKMIRNWTVAWCMNGAGSLFWAYFLAYQSNALQDLGRAELAINVALKKTNQPWHAIFLKGVGANFMVCIGLWQATCAEEVAGKVLGVWFPIAGESLVGVGAVLSLCDDDDDAIDLLLTTTFDSFLNYVHNNMYLHQLLQPL
jgi:formate transporter